MVDRIPNIKIASRYRHRNICKKKKEKNKMQYEYWNITT